LEVTGIICEYNPLHAGHAKQLQLVKSTGCAVVCLMSGNFVQRGAPAIVDKMQRAKAAVLCGADLVLELPVTACLSSAEGFATEGVKILSAFCQKLCFGAENADAAALMATARCLLTPEFSQALRLHLDTGLSFPAARQKALEAMGADSQLLSTPNNILAVEYCKAVLTQNAPMEIFPIHREGSYHATQADTENPSATAVRQEMLADNDWKAYIPEEAAACFDGVPLHSLEAGEKAILARLRCMTEQEFENLPHGSEGLWRKFMHAVQEKATVEDILAAVKSKRYTYTRLCRMLMSAFLGITRDMLATPAPYVRVLAFNDTGRAILKEARNHGNFPNIGEKQEHPYQLLEDRCGDLYGLFAQTPEAPGITASARVYHHK